MAADLTHHKYKCSLCQYVGKTSGDKKRHMARCRTKKKRLPGDAMYKCKKCHQDFSSASLLSLHRDICLKMCSFCPKTFPRASQRIEHEGKEHRFISCGNCKLYRTRTKQTLQTHIIRCMNLFPGGSKKRPTFRKAEPNQLNCSICKIFKTNSKKTLLKHSIGCLDLVHKSRLIQIKSKPREFAEKFQCTLCSRVLCSYGAKKTHMSRCRKKINQGVLSSNKCNTCSVEYPNLKLLKDHEKECCKTCTFCKKVFANKSNRIKHEKIHRALECDSCKVKIASKKDLKQHVKQCILSGLLPEKCKKKSGKGQPKVVYLWFPTQTDFEIWKERTELKTLTKYYNRTSVSGKGVTYTYYNCQHKPRNLSRPPKTDRQRSFGKVPDHKCESTIRVRKDEYGIKVAFRHEHTHTPTRRDLNYQHFPRTMRMRVIEKLKAKICVKRIIADELAIKWSRGLRFFSMAIDKTDFFNSTYLSKLRSKLKALGFLHSNDAIATSLLIDGLQREKFKPVTLYKEYEGDVIIGDMSALSLHPEYKTLFCVGLQTDIQREMLIRFGGKVVCSDATHDLTGYGFMLYALVVKDDTGKGYPVAYLITSHMDTTVLSTFLQSIHKRCPEVNITCSMSDDDKAIQSAFRKVFGPDLTTLLCHWHVPMSWKRNLKKIKNESKREEVMYLLMQALKTRSVEEFHKIICTIKNEYADCTRFLDYLHEHYFNRPETWAQCYRNFFHDGVNTNMLMESLFNLFKTVKLERRSNVRVDALIQMLLDADIERFKKYIIDKTKMPEISMEPTDRHKRGMRIDDASVTDVSTGKWSISSCTTRGKSYLVQRRKCIICKDPHCYIKCSAGACQELCEHQYYCDCPDADPLCKHIHKVHASNGRKIAQKQFAATQSVKTTTTILNEPRTRSAVSTSPSKMLCTPRPSISPTLSTVLKKAFSGNTNPWNGAIIHEPDVEMTQMHKKTLPPKKTISPNKRLEKQPNFKPKAKTAKKVSNTAAIIRAKRKLALSQQKMSSVQSQCTQELLAIRSPPKVQVTKIIGLSAAGSVLRIQPKVPLPANPSAQGQITKLNGLGAAGSVLRAQPKVPSAANPSAQGQITKIIGLGAAGSVLQVQPNVQGSLPTKLLNGNQITKIVGIPSASSIQGVQQKSSRLAATNRLHQSSITNIIGSANSVLQVQSQGSRHVALNPPLQNQITKIMSLRAAGSVLRVVQPKASVPHPTHLQPKNQITKIIGLPATGSILRVQPQSPSNLVRLRQQNGNDPDEPINKKQKLKVQGSALKLPVAVGNFIFTPPQMSGQLYGNLPSKCDTTECLFYVENIAISHRVLKCIEHQPSSKDLELLNSESRRLTAGWLCDDVIDAYMLLLCKKFQFMYPIACCVAKCLWEGKFNTRDRKGSTPTKLCLAKYLLLPMNLSSNHWSLLILDKDENKFMYLDSLNHADVGSTPIPDIAMDNIRLGLKCFWNTACDDAKLLSVPCSMQKDSKSCGVFVLHFAEMCGLKLPFTTDCEPESYRKHIFNTLLANGKASSD